MVAVGDHRGEEGAPPHGLRIAVTERAGWAVVAFAGELDLAEAAEAERALAAALDSAPRDLEADLTGVTFLGSIGVRVLLDARARAEAAGRRLRVLAGDGPVRRLIELVGLAEQLDLTEPTG